MTHLAQNNMHLQTNNTKCLLLNTDRTMITHTRPYTAHLLTL